MARLLLLAAALLLQAAGACAEERILAYHSEIALAADGSMSVTETVRVRAEGDRIRRGIYRDFPTDYRDPAGHRIRVGFDFVDAFRDGAVEHWRSERVANGVRVYLGQEQVFLAPGEYTYTLRYRTDRMVYFGGERHDELYWNVTGNGWDFAIDAASARITLPEAVPPASLAAYGYTGVADSREVALSARVFVGGAEYAATRSLGAREGLSVVLEFPKGIVTAPDAAQRARWLLADNRHILSALFGILLLWAWYGTMWRRHGRDPAPGVRIPVYEPPQGYSPASLRYVRNMGYDQKTFAAALLSLASKGALAIGDDDGVITLRRTGAAHGLAAGEAALHAKLFANRESLLLKQSKATAAVMQAAQGAHKGRLAADYEKKYFVTNAWVLVPGVLLSLLVLGVSLASVPGEEKFAAMFLCVWLSFWSVAVFALVSAAVAAMRGARGIGGKIGAAGLWLFALPFLAGEVAGLFALAMTAGVGFVLAFAMLLGTNLLFQHWMKAPTQLGARLLDRIEGFRWYLGVAEKQELDSQYRPEARPERFSELLPYALALDVEQAWAERFADALTPAQLAEAQPSWYHGRRGFGSGSLAGFTSGLSSSLSSGIASASTAPGSSSGRSGGSGGGGGGGGGGGW